MDRDDLARWTRFAMKGGIGKCVAICDCIAENNDDLMFLKDDEITVLLQVQDADGLFLGYCEGVIGRFQAKHVNFLTKLKKPIMAKRSSIASLKSKSPTPPGTSNGGPIRFKTPTPTFGLATTPTSETPPIPGSSNASVRTDSRASVGQQQYWKSPPHSPVNTTFTIGGSSSNRSSGATGWRVEGERRVSGGAGMRAAHHQQSSLGDGSVASRRMDSISSSYSAASDSATPSTAMSTSTFSTSTSITSLSSSVADSPQQLPSFSSFAPPPPSISPPPAVSQRPPSVTPPPVSLPPPPRHSLASSSSLPSSSNIMTTTDDEPLLPPPTIKPSSSWNRASMLERQFDLVQQQADELREVRDQQGWDSGTDEGHGGVGSRSMSVVEGAGSVKGSPAGTSGTGSVRSRSRGGGDEEEFGSPGSDRSGSRPRPLDLTLDLPISPLRISKKSPLVLHHRIPSHTSSQMRLSSRESSLKFDETDIDHLEPPQTSMLSTSTSILDSESYSTTIQRRLSSSTASSNRENDDDDGEVGIGLSLLQNLVAGSDSEGEGDGDGDDGSVYSVEYSGDSSAPPRSAFSGGFGGGNENDEGIGTDEDEDGTVEGLVYGSASDDDDDDLTKEDEPLTSAVDFPMPPTSPNSSGGSSLSKSISMASLASSGSKPLSIRREKDWEREREGQMTETPTTPTSPTPNSSFARSPYSVGGSVVGSGGSIGGSGVGLSPPVSPRSPSFAFSTTRFLSSSSPSSSSQQYPFPAPPGSSHSQLSSSSQFQPPSLTERERRKSLAPSITSQGSSTTTWDGAGDIYDNYRYSRMSMSSKVSSSVGSRERRGSQGTVASFTGGFGAGEGGGEVPPMPERQGTGEVRNRVGSDVSVYSVNNQSASFVGGEGRVRTGSMLSSTSNSSSKSKSVLNPSNANPNSNSSPPAASSKGTRPTPLDFTEDSTTTTTTSPLLHATWGSPVSSPGASSTAYPPPSAFNLDSATTPRPPLTATTANILKTPMTASTMIEVSGVGMVGMGGGGLVGMASAMRRRVEAESAGSPLTSPTFGSMGEAMRKGQAGGKGGMEEVVDDSMVSGLGNGIVVDDEEELPSRIIGSTSFEDEGDSRVMMTDSPEPEDLDGDGDGDRTVEGTTIDEEDDEVTEVINEAAIKAAAPSFPPGLTTPMTTTTISISSPTPPPPSTTPVSGEDSLAQYASHLRPSLRDLREGGMVRVEGTGERRSLFMPHPNAPKAPPMGMVNGEGGVGLGPMYVRQQGQPPPPPMPHQMGGGMPYQGPHSPPVQGYYQQPYHPQQPMPPRAPFGFVLGQVRAAIHAQQHAPPPPMPPHAAGGRPPPPPRRRGATIYGRLEVDLATSMGPVPVVWSLDPPPTKVMHRQPSQMNMNGGHPGPHPVPPPGVPHPGPHPGPQIGPHAPSPLANSGASSGPSLGVPPTGRGSPGSAPSQNPTGLPPMRRPNATSLRESSLPERGGSPLANSTMKASDLGSGSGETSNANGGGAGGAGVKPIPRLNFYPKAASSRPRSRSFSDLKSAAGSQSSSLRSSLSGGEIKKSTSITGSNISSPSPATSSSSSTLTLPNASNKPVKSSPLRPSPLSLSVTNPSPSTSPLKVTTTLNVPMPLRSPASPLAQTSFPPPASPSAATSPVPPSPSVSSILSVNTNGATNTLPLGAPSIPGAGPHLRKLASSTSSSASRQSSTSINDTSSAITNLTTPVSSTRDSSSSSNLGVGRPIPVSRSTLPVSIAKSASMVDLSGNASTTTTASPTIVGGGGPGSLPTRMGSLSTDDGSGGGQRESASSGSERSQLVTSPIPMVQTPTVVRQSSLRAKLSLPNLRRNRSRQDELPVSPIVDAQQDLLLQVQDMEFELVRPNLNQYLSAARSSEDSSVLGRDGLDVGPIPGNNTTPYLRAESPAISMLSSEARSPTIEGSMSWGAATPGPSSSPIATRPPPESESQMEAHRNRELKWMSLLSSSPPSQARKTKKVRKLLLDGVPSSVRYLVWSHLTDGKARCVPGVYEQLYKRGKVPLTEEIEKNVEKGPWFAREEQSQLRTLAEAGGGVVQLLQAYLNMVPDIQYMPGLPHIVGQLLLLAPEEDAFWIFISIMDTHIRPYFSSGSTQMEVDSALFSRALEVNDAAVAKKLLVDMGISPSSICAPWFSSLYVGCLPPEYLTRTWDLFLYDGIPFLLRVGLAIVSFVRRQLLECTSEEAALNLLHRPPPISLPPSPENYLSFILSIKLKDDDVRKQRIKMEAQVKRQAQQQQPRPSNAGGSISLPRP